MAAEILLKLLFFVSSLLTLLPVNYALTKYLLGLDGPFNVFLKLRLWSGITEAEIVEDGETRKVRFNDTNFFAAKVLSCHNCLAPYTSLVVGVLGSYLIDAIVGGMGDGLTPAIIGISFTPFLSGLTIILFDYLGTEY